MAVSGTRTVSPTATITYTLTATGATGPVTATATVTVTNPPVSPTATLSVSPATITAGQAATLTWSTSNATAVSLNQGIGAVALSGTRTVSPTATATYALTATNATGAVMATATVTLAAGPCTASITPTTQDVVAEGATHTATVTAGAGCAWTAASTTPAFITVTGGASGTGPGTVTYTVAANATAETRLGTLTIATQTLTVNQAAGGGSTTPPTVLITTPTANPAIGTSPFITLAGTADDDALVTTVTWASNRGPTGTANGTTVWSADVPLFAGENSFTVTATDNTGATRTATQTVNVSAFSYYFAEGATGPFFDLDLLLGNPNAVDVPITIDFLRDDGTIVSWAQVLEAHTRSSIRVDDIAGLESTSVSAVVTSTSGAADARRADDALECAGVWRAHGEGDGGRSLNWFFAEGSQGFFDTYLLLANPHPAPNVATVQFLTETGGVVTRTYTVPANSRFNVHAGSIPELVNKSFGDHRRLHAAGRRPSARCTSARRSSTAATSRPA